MPFTPLNSTSPIVAFTFPDLTTKNLGVNVVGLGDPTLNSAGAGLVGQCAALQIQNLTAGIILVMSTAGGTKGINIAAGALYSFPDDPNGNGIDLFEFWLKPAAVGDVIVFYRKR